MSSLGSKPRERRTRSASTERLITFEVGGAGYALPIADVAEVTEVGSFACIPTLPVGVGGVMNHHGDALPIVNRDVLFDVSVADLPPPQHLLVLARSPDDPGGLGLPVDRILGLVEGEGGTAHDDDGVVERRPIDGRVISVLDTQRLLSRALEAIEAAIIGSVPMHGGDR